jgi:hypothetical protein
MLQQDRPGVHSRVEQHDRERGRQPRWPLRVQLCQFCGTQRDRCGCDRLLFSCWCHGHSRYGSVRRRVGSFGGRLDVVDLAVENMMRVYKHKMAFTRRIATELEGSKSVYRILQFMHRNHEKYSRCSIQKLLKLLRELRHGAFFVVYLPFVSVFCGVYAAVFAFITSLELKFSLKRKARQETGRVRDMPCSDVNPTFRNISLRTT